MAIKKLHNNPPPFSNFQVAQLLLKNKLMHKMDLKHRLMKHFKSVMTFNTGNFSYGFSFFTLIRVQQQKSHSQPRHIMLILQELMFVTKAPSKKLRDNHMDTSGDEKLNSQLQVNLCLGAQQWAFFAEKHLYFKVRSIAKKHRIINSHLSDLAFDFF